MRVRLANPPVGLVAKYTKKERDFFSEYASTVLVLVSSPEVRILLEKLINLERIRSNSLIDLRVMMFPAMPLNGRPRNALHGSYNHDFSQINRPIYYQAHVPSCIHEFGQLESRRRPAV